MIKHDRIYNYGVLSLKKTGFSPNICPLVEKMSSWPSNIKKERFFVLG
jgi:hypothetical protein